MQRLATLFSSGSHFLTAVEEDSYYVKAATSGERPTANDPDDRASPPTDKPPTAADGIASTWTHLHDDVSSASVPIASVKFTGAPVSYATEMKQEDSYHNHKGGRTPTPAATPDAQVHISDFPHPHKPTDADNAGTAPVQTVLGDVTLQHTEERVGVPPQPLRARAVVDIHKGRVPPQVGAVWQCVMFVSPRKATH
ncbi:MAG: hypothetical protein WDW38_011302 [Sanguina aurantia]